MLERLKANSGRTFDNLGCINLRLAMSSWNSDRVNDYVDFETLESGF